MAATILAENTITLTAAGEANGAGWGVWKPRAVRRSDDTLAFVIMSDNPAYQDGGTPGPGPDSQGNPWWQYTHTWTIFTFDGTAWSALPNPNADNAICGREPPCLLLGLNDELYVIGWPPVSMADSLNQGAVPTLFRQSTGFAPEPIPGDWSTVPVSNEHWPYCGASIDEHGQIVMVQAVAAGGQSATPDVPGMFRYAWATPVAGQPVQWTQGTIPPSAVPFRCTVNYPFLNADGSLDIISTIDTKREEQGYPVAPNGAWDYLENATYLWHLPALGAPSPDAVTLHEEKLTGNTIPQFYAFDAYKDTNGLLHVLVEWDGDDLPNGGNYSTAHVVVDQQQHVTVTQIALPFARLARVTQDASGRFWFISLYQGVLYLQPGLDGDTDGSKLDVVQQIALTGTYPDGTESAVYSTLSGAPVSRSGTRGLSNVLDILWNRYDFRWYHVQVQLSTDAPLPQPNPEPAPSPSPEPSPEPSPTPDPCADCNAQLTALQSTVTDLQTQLTTLQTALTALQSQCDAATQQAAQKQGIIDALSAALKPFIT
jgi:hypothetical protein